MDCAGFDFDRPGRLDGTLELVGDIVVNIIRLESDDSDAESYKMLAGSKNHYTSWSTCQSYKSLTLAAILPDTLN